MTLLEIAGRVSPGAQGRRLEIRGALDVDGRAMVFDVEERAGMVILHCHPKNGPATVESSSYDPRDGRCVKVVRWGHRSLRCGKPAGHLDDCLPNIPA